MRAYEAALAIDPEEAYAGYNLAKLLFAGGDAERAEDLLRRALQNKPDFPEALVVLAGVLESRGDLAQALSLLEAAMRARPGYAGAVQNAGLLLTQMGNALVRLGKPWQAAERYRRALELCPGLADAHCYLGSLLVDRGSFDEARDHLDKAVALKPGLAEAHLGQGNLQHALQQYEAAEASYRRALALDPRFVGGAHQSRPPACRVRPARRRPGVL